MQKKQKRSVKLIFLFFILIFSISSYAIKTQASFSVVNYSPEIMSIELDGDELFIGIQDRNGLSDIISVKTFVNDVHELNISRIDKNDINAKYIYDISEYNVQKVLVSAGDSVKNVNKTRNFGGMITGYTVNKIRNNFILDIIKYIKELFV